MAMYVLVLAVGLVGVLVGAAISAWVSLKVFRQHHLVAARVRQHRAVRTLADFLECESARISLAVSPPTHADYRYIGAVGAQLAMLASIEAIDVDVIDALTKARSNLVELRTYALTEPLLEETVRLVVRAARETSQRAAGRKPTTYLGALVT